MTIAPLLFAELPLEGRIMVLDNIFANLTADQVQTLVSNPPFLGLLCEAHSGHGIEYVADVADELVDGDFHELAALVNEALLARLPNPA